jgi:transcriptional regulator with XRE-family HTH domain/DNA-binding XRE family transcriptional regulator
MQDTVSERIKILVEKYGSKPADFAKATGLTSQNVYDLTSGRKGDPSFASFKKILIALPDINERWLMLGEGEMLKSATSLNTSSLHSAQTDPELRVLSGISVYNPVEGLPRRKSTRGDILDEIRVLLKQVLAERELRRFDNAQSAINHYAEVSPRVPNASTAPLPAFDRMQMDKRFLTELARLLEANAFATYEVWAQAVGVNPNYVAAIEKGRYHFNIELLYNTVRLYPAFDFIYVVFGSAWSDRPEPTGFPKRTRGPRPKVAS